MSTPWFYYVIKVLLKGLLLLTRWRVKGRANVPGQGPLLIVANHLHLADPPLLGMSLGRKVRFMAKQELFHSRALTYFIRGLGAIPVQRGRLDRKALRQTMSLLAQGEALVMFPEGMRSKNTQLQPAFAGAALIAHHAGAPVLPVGITGTEKIKGIGWLWRRPELTVNIGRPFQLPPTSGRLTRVQLAELTNSIMGHIAPLLPKEYQGDYADQGNEKK